MIGIIITTFLRDDLLFKSIQSILDNWNQEFKIIIIDQGNTGNIQKHNFIDKNNLSSNYHIVPFNSGLSYCRNYGVQKAKELGCEYCFIGSDSFLFNESIKKINNIVNILENTDYDLIGVELIPSVCGWEAKLNLIEGKHFELDFIDKDKKLAKSYITKAEPSTEYQNEDGSPVLVGDVIYLWDIDICRNIFIAKTESLLNTKWDDNLKLCFHKDTPIIIKNGYDQISCIPIKHLFPPSVKQNNFHGYKKQKVSIWTHEGWKKLEVISKKYTSEKLYKIYTNTGCIFLTENHELIINDRKIKANQLKINDTVNMYDYPILSNKLSINKNWAWLLGFFLAEGTCLSGKKKQKRIEFTNQNISLLKKCEKIFNNLGVNCKWYINKNRKDNCKFLRIDNPNLLSSFFLYFYLNNEKTIPYFIYDFDKPSRIAFFKGLFDGDGGKHNKNAHLFYNKYAHIINGLIWLSKDFCNCHSIRNRKNKFGEWFVLNLKHTTHEHHSSKITNIEIINEWDEEVYDIQCEGNIFCAGINNIKVHNCEHESFFHEYKQNGYKCAWTNALYANKMTDRPREYTNLRRSNFNEGLLYLRKKYNISNWVEYKNLERAKNYQKYSNLDK